MFRLPLAVGETIAIKPCKTPTAVNLRFEHQRSKFIIPAIAKPNITQMYLGNFVFAVPPLDEQHAILTQVENLLGRCALLQTEIENLDIHSKTL